MSFLEGLERELAIKWGRGQFQLEAIHYVDGSKSDTEIDYEMSFIYPKFRNGRVVRWYVDHGGSGLPHTVYVFSVKTSNGG